MIMKVPMGSNSFFASDSTDEYSDGEESSFDEQEDFSEYMWMEHEEEFEKEELQRLEEEALMEQAEEAMIEDEIAEQVENEAKANNNESNLSQVLSSIRLEMTDVEKSTLNPLAEEFIPSPAPIKPKS